MFSPDTAGSRTTEVDGNDQIGKRRNRKKKTVLERNRFLSCRTKIGKGRNNGNYSSTEYALVI